VTAYSAVQTLYMYGYEKESQQLADLLFDMMSMAIANKKGGVYENYRPDDGKAIGCFQFGWSSAFTMEIALERYQRLRYIMPDECSFSGYVKNAISLKDNRVLYSVETGEYNVPRIAVSSEKSLETAAESGGEFTVEVSDPHKMTKGEHCNITLDGFTFNAKEGHRYKVSIGSSNVVGAFERILDSCSGCF